MKLSTIVHVQQLCNLFSVKSILKLIEKEKIARFLCEIDHNCVQQLCNIKHEIPPVLVLLHITICFFQSVVHFSGDFHVTFPYLFVVIFSQLSFILLVIFSQLSLIKHKIPPLLVLLHFIS